MSSSYRQLHYAQRPAKNVERKMIVESLASLGRLERPEQMRYVGLGSVYFTDFILVHRTLGITDMVSIEKDESPNQRKRFAMNRPFRDIRIEHGRASAVLPDLGWDVPTITWLDYDDPLDDEMLGDVETVTRHASATTVLIVTVSAEPGSIAGDPTRSTDRVRATRKRLPGLLPHRITTDAHLGGWKLADLSYNLLTERIALTLEGRDLTLVDATRSTRAPSRDPEIHADTFEWSQFLHFRYQDGARMLTLGGILHRHGDAPKIADCGVRDKLWAKSGADPFLITIPKLTTRETLMLDQLMPDGIPPGKHVHGVPPAEVAAYAQLYRHLPIFVDAVI